MKKTEQGGVACGACGIPLQEASFTFGVGDIVHGILGVAVIITMIIKKEGDELDRQTIRPERRTGYNKWLENLPVWILHWLLAAFIFQVVLGIILSLGAAYRNSFVCSAWLVTSFLTTLTTPSTYFLIGLGRLYEFAVVLEFVWKMDEEEAHYNTVERSLDFDKQMRRKSTYAEGDGGRGRLD